MNKCYHEICEIIGEEEKGLSVFLIGECFSCKEIIETEKGN
jgi:hypothetical protein